jgi:hypothetical protein
MLPGVVRLEGNVEGFQVSGFDERFEFGHCRLTTGPYLGVTVRQGCL